MTKHILMRCPFCGGPANMFYGMSYVTAGCNNDDCGINPSVDAKNSGEGVADRVAKIWNTRADVSTVQVTERNDG